MPSSNVQPEPASLREQQQLFANHLRNPEKFPPPPDVEPRRLAIYQRLFFNNINQLLASGFPVLRSIFNDTQWDVLIRDFYTRHRCETPLFPFVAGELVDYLLHERDDPQDWPFLAELAQFEWSEILLRHDATVLPPQQGFPDVSGCVAGRELQLSPLCLPLVFRFPVHRICRDLLPDRAPDQPTYLLVCRRRNDEIRVTISNATSFRLLQLLADESLPDIAAICHQLAQEIQHPDPLLLQGMVTDTLRELWQSECLYARLQTL